MQNITVDKNRLLTSLKTNRTHHLELFNKAQKKYREQVIAVLDTRLADAKAGRRIITFIDLPEPVNYTDKFDEAIAMVEWAEGDTMDLSEKDFQRYVLNKWEWAQAFAASTTSYLVS